MAGCNANTHHSILEQLVLREAVHPLDRPLREVVLGQVGGVQRLHIRNGCRVQASKAGERAGGGAHLGDHDSLAFRGKGVLLLDLRHRDGVGSVLLQELHDLLQSWRGER